ncbi:MAG TPA: RluA family pseudouridine synthase [Candidatus Vogelbacteria bacterium]|nr:RluA family pseudouridine synthase [Candidatus Vogelbacteria bacterium]
MKKIDVIYEDEDVIVFNKPAGLAIHGDDFSSEETLVDYLLENYPDIKGIGEDYLSPKGKVFPRPGIVHRLDKETTGLLICVKNQKSFLYLKKQFKNHLIKKEYRLLVYGHLKKERGEISLPIGRSRKDPRKRLVGSRASGKLRPAITIYNTLEKFTGYSYLSAWPKTGRTHQLRVHFSYLGHPVVGDRLYAGSREYPKELKHQALHAYSLEFKALSGKIISLKADLPADFKVVLENLKKMC